MKDDFSTRTLEALLIKKGIISLKSRFYVVVVHFLNHLFTGIINEKKEDENNVYDESRRRTVRSSAYPDSDSD